jgi:uncharacterized repeat protein (TIGR03803 family)
MRDHQPLALAVFVAIFTITAQAQFSVLYNYGTNFDDPITPSGVVAQGRDGKLYGAAAFGGAFSCGAVFKITTNGTYSKIHDVETNTNEGCYLEGGLTLGTDGNFYGTTAEGGVGSGGTIFKMTPSGSVTVLYSFTNGSDGGFPFAPPVQARDGNFYGTTSEHGANGYGTVYKLTSGGTFSTLHQFDLTDGAAPLGPLVQGTDGSLYGTASSGGADGLLGSGVVFKITTAGNLTVLHSFSDNPDGAEPDAGLIQGTDGNYYGTTRSGGTSGAGVVFKITPAGTLTVLHSMESTADGGNPVAGLVQASDGNFYGANVIGGSLGYGTLFKITASGTFSVLYNFDGTTGSEPSSTLFQHTNGILYSDAFCGGRITSGSPDCDPVNTSGVFYSLNEKLKGFVSLLPYSGKVGSKIGIFGQGFTNASTVSFNGTASTATFVSGTYLTATVPTGATTGFVTVTTSTSTLKSKNRFRVTP